MLIKKNKNIYKKVLKGAGHIIAALSVLFVLIAVYTEIEEAYRAGKLEKNDLIVLSNVGRPFQTDEIPEILRFAAGNFRDNISYSDLCCALPDPLEYSEKISKVESVTNMNVIQKEDSTYYFVGWIFSEKNRDDISMVIKSDDEVIYEVSFTESSDVYEAYEDEGDYQNAQNCRFSIKSEENLSDYTLNVFLNDELLYEGSVADFSEIQQEDIHMCMDANVNIVETNYVSLRADKNVKIANLVIKIYQITGFGIMILAMVLFFMELIGNLVSYIRKKPVDYADWLIRLGILLTLACDYVVVAINYFDAYNAMGASGLYTAGTHPLWQIFVCLNLIYGIRQIKNIKFQKADKRQSPTAATDPNDPQSQLGSDLPQ